MRTPDRFVKPLSDSQRQELNRLMKTSNEPVRRRAHAILLSARGYSVGQIADIYEVDRDTVSRWLDSWEEEGEAGLADQAGRGRPPILNEKEQKQAIGIVEKDPRPCQTEFVGHPGQDGQNDQRRYPQTVAQASGQDVEAAAPEYALEAGRS